MYNKIFLVRWFGKNPFCHGILLFYDPLKHNIVYGFSVASSFCCVVLCDLAENIYHRHVAYIYTRRPCLDEGLLLHFNMRKRKSMYDLPPLNHSCVYPPVPPPPVCTKKNISSKQFIIMS